MRQLFTGKVALVTAAASGIGEATAHAIAAEGAAIMLSDINPEGLQQVAQQLAASGAQVATQVTDCGNESEIQALVQNTVKQFGRLDYAANVVGHTVGDSMGPDFHHQDTQAWSDTLHITLTSAYMCMKHEIAYMLDHGGGAIVNVSSLAGKTYVPAGGAAYAAAKAGVIQLTKYAAASYGERGIRVNCLAPGTTSTKTLVEKGKQNPTMIDTLVSEHVIKRLIEPREQAAAAVWLLSDNAAMVTGHVMTVDGGWSSKL